MIQNWKGPEFKTVYVQVYPEMLFVVPICHSEPFI